LAFLIGPFGLLYTSLLLSTVAILGTVTLAFALPAVQGIYDWRFQLISRVAFAIAAGFYALSPPKLNHSSILFRFDRPSWIKALIFIVLAFGCIFAFTRTIATFTDMNGYSMIPAIGVHDRVATIIAPLLRGNIAHGSVVRYRFSFQKDSRRFTLVSRVVALEGDTVEMKAGLLYVNGKPADNSAHISILRAAGCIMTDGPESNLASIGVEGEKEAAELQIPAGYVYVLADNRAGNFEDSRVFGPIPLSDITGVLRISTPPVIPRTRADCLPPSNQYGR
jgi:signal peptidase I